MPRTIGKGKVQILQLCMTDEQKDAVQLIYSSGRDIFHVFLDDPEAGSIFARKHKFDIKSRAALDSKWATCWVNKWETEKGADICRRVLLQCACSYNTPARQAQESGRKSYKTINPPSEKEWERRAPYDFTNCLAHVDVTFQVRSGAILRVQGHLEHNNECQLAKVMRTPPVPLHPHVIEIALQQLRDGASPTAVEMKNVDLYKKKFYNGQLRSTANPASSTTRYQILPYDFSRLYRLHARNKGVDIDLAPEKNVDEWLDPQSPKFKPDLKKAVFHYHQRTEKDECFILCIATEEMDNAAWKFCHRSQLLLDGTFGVCSSKLLLFIAMAIDDDGKGVPVALFLFSAPTGNRATQAGYDSGILEELLKTWHYHLGMRNNEGFCPLVCITDTDTKERLALLKVWPLMVELLCGFHVRQCWTNKRRNLFRNKMSDSWKCVFEKRLKDLEEALIQSNDFLQAKALVEAERRAMVQFTKIQDAESAANALLLMLGYIDSYWMQEALYFSWSRKGKEFAAAVLGKSIDVILPTTNHLESFNGLLKRKYIQTYRHANTQLRFDMLIHLLIMDILPHIFDRRRIIADFKTWTTQLFPTAAKSISPTKESRVPNQETKLPTLLNNPVAYYESDQRRDLRAQEISGLSVIHPKIGPKPNEYISSCLSTKASDPFAPDSYYWMTVHSSGTASCTCLDWLTHEGACKHLRALRLVIEQKKGLGDSFALQFYFPTSKAEALHIIDYNRKKYGDSYNDHITSSATALNSPQILHLSSDVLHQTAVLQDAASDPYNTNNDFDGRKSNSNPGDGTTTEITTQVLPLTTPPVIMPSLMLEGVVTQIQTRIEHSVKHVLPSLHGISHNLTDINEYIRSTPDLLEFKQVIAELHGKLHHICSEPITASSQQIHQAPTNQSATKTASQSTGRKRALPPSPDRSNKRFDSRTIV